MDVLRKAAKVRCSVGAEKRGRMPRCRWSSAMLYVMCQDISSLGAYLAIYPAQDKSNFDRSSSLTTTTSSSWSSPQASLLNVYGPNAH